MSYIPRYRFTAAQQQAISMIAANGSAIVNTRVRSHLIRREIVGPTGKRHRTIRLTERGSSLHAAWMRRMKPLAASTESQER